METAEVKPKKKPDKKKERRLKWHRWVWNNLMPIVKVFVRLHYGPMEFEPAPALEGGYIVLPNHACGGDQFFVSFSFPRRQMYFLCSEHSFRNRFLGFLMKFLLGPISRVKGSVDASAVIALMRWLRQGVPICMFPEGNRSWNGRTAPLHPTTAKFLRSAGVPVVTYRIEGGYLSDPRWSKHLRRGKISGKVVNIYQPAELKKMTPAQIEEVVSRDLWVDADECQRVSPLPFKGKGLAEGLEEALFLCPKCGKIGTLRSHGNDFDCQCGLHATYNELGRFDEGAPFATVAEWDDWQRAELSRRADAAITLSDEGAEIWQMVGEHKMRRVAEGRLTLDKAGLHLGTMSFPVETMQQPELCHLGGKETLMFSNPEGSFELRFRNSTSRRKYHLLLSDYLRMAQIDPA